MLSYQRFLKVEIRCFQRVESIPFFGNLHTTPPNSTWSSAPHSAQTGILRMTGKVPARLIKMNNLRIFSIVYKSKNSI